MPKMPPSFVQRQVTLGRSMLPGSAGGHTALVSPEPRGPLPALAIEPEIDESVWTTYDVSWITQGGGADPTLGNGILNGAYLRNGGMIHFRIQLVYGSTTTGGSGPWEFSIPLLPTVPYEPNDAVFMTGYAENFGINGYSIASGRFADEGYFLIHSGTTGNAFNATTPFAWGNTDFFIVNGLYQITGHSYP